MIDSIHDLVEHYGLWAVFADCIAEGETAAILAGFFVHQAVFERWHAFLAVAGGAFVGDVLLFLAGRRFAHRPFVQRLRERPGFSRAMGFVDRRPTAFVLLNRYAYGLRLAGGVAAGLSAIPWPNFLLLNALASAVWALLFMSVGYFFGAGAEQVIGAELARHERLLIALGIGLACVVVFGLFARRFARRARTA